MPEIHFILREPIDTQRRQMLSVIRGTRRIPEAVNLQCAWACSDGGSDRVDLVCNQRSASSNLVRLAFGFVAFQGQLFVTNIRFSAPGVYGSGPIPFLVGTKRYRLNGQSSRLRAHPRQVSSRIHRAFQSRSDPRQNPCNSSVRAGTPRWVGDELVVGRGS